MSPGVMCVVLLATTLPQVSSPTVAIVVYDIVDVADTDTLGAQWTNNTSFRRENVQRRKKIRKNYIFSETEFGQFCLLDVLCQGFSQLHGAIHCLISSSYVAGEM